MTRSHLVPASQTKDIHLPFNGLYSSYLGELLGMELEGYSEEACDFVYSLDLKQYHKALTDGYASFLIDTINDKNNLTIVISGIEYVPMNGQNMGDTLHCTVNVDSLPAIDVSELQPYATDALTSCSGFISFYSPDMSQLKGVSYENWQYVYIGFIIEYLVSECDDIEQDYIESLNCNGGAIELLMGNISAEDCDKLNKLLYKD